MFLIAICVCLLRDELKPSRLLLFQVRLIDLKYSLIGMYSDSCFMQEVRIWSEFLKIRTAMSTKWVSVNIQLADEGI